MSSRPKRTFNKGLDRTNDDLLRIILTVIKKKNKLYARVLDGIDDEMKNSAPDRFEAGNIDDNISKLGNSFDDDAETLTFDQRCMIVSFAILELKTEILKKKIDLSIHNDSYIMTRIDSRILNFVSRLRNERENNRMVGFDHFNIGSKLSKNNRDDPGDYDLNILNIYSPDQEVDYVQSGEWFEHKRNILLEISSEYQIKVLNFMVEYDNDYDLVAERLNIPKKKLYNIFKDIRAKIKRRSKKGLL